MKDRPQIYQADSTKDYIRHIQTDRSQKIKQDIKRMAPLGKRLNQTA